MRHSPSPARLKILGFALIGGSLLGLVATPGRAAEPQSVNAVSMLGNHVPRRAILLAIDDYSLPLKTNLCYYLSKPKVRPEAVLSPSRDNPNATDTVAAHFYGSVLRDGGKFRMWYYGVGSKDKTDRLNSESQPDILLEGPICYAESDDGLHWTKPNLGQVERNGSSDNNAIALPPGQTEGAFVILDEKDPDPARRFKMIYERTEPRDEKQRPTADLATSPDGIHWKPAGIAAHALEPSSFYRFNGLYYINAQNISNPSIGEGGHKSGRQGFVWVSTDFDHWLPDSGESFVLPEPANPNDRGGDRPYTQVHLGVGAASFGNVLVGLYCQWQARPISGDWFGNGTTFGDLGLVVSNDGQHFREPVKGHVFLDRHDSPPAVSPQVRYEIVLAQSGNGILNVGDETWIYHGRWANTEHYEDYHAEVGLATLPRDRWGSLGRLPRLTEGEVWTALMTLGKPGCNLTLNADGVQGMSVEVADENFHLLPEYSGANAAVSTAKDGLDCAVRWPKASLDTLVGKPVRFLIHLKKGRDPEPRLFAVYVASE